MVGVSTEAIRGTDDDDEEEEEQEEEEAEEEEEEGEGEGEEEEEDEEQEEGGGGGRRRRRRRRRKRKRRRGRSRMRPTKSVAANGLRVSSLHSPVFRGSMPGRFSIWSGFSVRYAAKSFPRKYSTRSPLAIPALHSTPCLVRRCCARSM